MIGRQLTVWRWPKPSRKRRKVIDTDARRPPSPYRQLGAVSPATLPATRGARPRVGRLFDGVPIAGCRVEGTVDTIDFYEILGILNGILRDPWRLHGLLGDNLIFRHHRLTGNFYAFLGILWDIMGFFQDSLMILGILWDSLRIIECYLWYYGILWDSFRILGIRWDIIGFYGILWGFLGILECYEFMMADGASCNDVMGDDNHLIAG